MNDDYIPEQWLENGDKLERIASVYNAAGFQTLNTTSTGYRQGGYAEVLVVADEDYYRLSGNDPQQDQTKNLQGVADTYTAWAWGDVYGYIVTKPNECTQCHHDEPEEIDSCWGYYGSDHDDSGLMQAAKDLRDVAEAYRQGFRGFSDDVPVREEVDFQVVDTIDLVGGWHGGGLPNRTRR